MRNDNSSLRGELLSIHPDLDVRSEAEELLAYSYDGTAALQQIPGVVVFARSTEQVSEVLRYASGRGIPVVTRGSGTGLSGGSLPTSGCILLCLSQMNRILELDPANLTLLAEAGAITASIAEAASGAGLF